MRLHTLRPNAGARHRKKRLGCGESSGHGKTSGRGHKGQKARTGAAIRPGFEGGQMPLHRRSPKRGFNNITFGRKVALVNVSGLEKRFEEDAVVNEASLREAGLVRGACDAVKILGTGSLTRRLTLEGVLCSASARQKVEEAGGVVRAPEER